MPGCYDDMSALVWHRRSGVLALRNEHNGATKVFHGDLNFSICGSWSQASLDVCWPGSQALSDWPRCRAM